MILSKSGFFCGFLSTPSGWRATQQEAQFTRQHNISIHALRVEGDYAVSVFVWTKGVFLSTPSGWRATSASTAILMPAEISIHALRVEGDVIVTFYNYFFFLFLSTPSGWRATLTVMLDRIGRSHFYPRPPGGGRPLTYLGISNTSLQFLSTPSGWRATRARRGGQR